MTLKKLGLKITRIKVELLFCVAISGRNKKQRLEK